MTNPSDVKVETRYGSISIPGGSDLISRCICEYGEWAFLEVLFASQFINSESRVWDLGGYVGTFALGVGQLAPSFILSVEADKDNFKHLSANLASLPPERVVVLNAACAAPNVHHGRIQRPTDNHGENKVVFGEDAADETDTVAAVSLDNLVSRFGSPTFVKLDIEGSEFAFLSQHTEWIRATDAVIYMECNNDPLHYETAKVFLSCGRDLYLFSFPAYNVDNYNKSKTNLLPGSHEAGLVAVQNGHAVTLAAELVAQGCRLLKISSIADLSQALSLTPRWAMPEWLLLSKTELIALLGECKVALYSSKT